MSIVDIKQAILRQSDLLADVAHELNESRRLAAMQADFDKVLAHCNYLASLLTELGGDELVPGIIQMTKSGKIGSSPAANKRTNHRVRSVLCVPNQKGADYTKLDDRNNVA